MEHALWWAGARDLWFVRHSCITPLALRHFQAHGPLVPPYMRSQCLALLHLFSPVSLDVRKVNRDDSPTRYEFQRCFLRVFWTTMGIAMRPMLLVFILAAVLSGCRSSDYAHRGAGLGGVTGAGVGALSVKQPRTIRWPELRLVRGSERWWGARRETLWMTSKRGTRRPFNSSWDDDSAGATSVGDVVAMSQSGLGDEVILQHLRTHGLAASPAPMDLIALKQQGVSDGVIRGMQEATGGGYVAQASAAVPVNPPVIVENTITVHRYPIAPIGVIATRAPIGTPAIPTLVFTGVCPSATN